MIQIGFVILTGLSITINSTPVKKDVDTNIGPCLSSFYSAAYHKSYNCTSGFEYLSNNSTVQKSAFTDGKSCFIEVAKDVCAPTDVVQINAEYNSFIEILTEKSSDETNCSEPYYQHSALKCFPVLQDMAVKLKDVVDVHTEINDTRVLKLINLCEQATACIKQTCLKETEQTRIIDTCAMIKMKNSEFIACNHKIQEKLADLSNHTCLDDFDFNLETNELTVELYSKKKECTLEIMRDSCGESAVDNFDYYADLLVKQSNPVQQLD